MRFGNQYGYLDFQSYQFREAAEYMHFTLYYDGPLPSAGNDSRKQEKQHIREQLYPQFLELWRTHPALPKISHREWNNWPEWGTGQIFLLRGGLRDLYVIGVSFGLCHL